MSIHYLVDVNNALGHRAASLTDPLQITHKVTYPYHECLQVYEYYAFNEVIFNVESVMAFRYLLHLFEKKKLLNIKSLIISW